MCDESPLFQEGSCPDLMPCRKDQDNISVEYRSKGNSSPVYAFNFECNKSSIL